MTIKELWGHFEKHELRSPRADRSPVTIETYLDGLRFYILPKWGETLLDEVRAVDVEAWLDSLVKSDKPRGRARRAGSQAKPACLVTPAKPEPLAPATKAKLRNQLSCIFSHAIRHELWKAANPISMVRQSGKRLRTPDKLSLAEMQAIVEALPSQIHRVAILIAASTGLRRSEIRGLQWQDVNFDDLWLNLRRGVVRKVETKLKTEGSRRGIPLPPDLAEVLRVGRADAAQSRRRLGARFTRYQRKESYLVGYGPAEPYQSGIEALANHEEGWVAYLETFAGDVVGLKGRGCESCPGTAEALERPGNPGHLPGGRYCSEAGGAEAY